MCNHNIYVQWRRSLNILEELVYLGIKLKHHNNMNKFGFERIGLHVRVARCLHGVYV